MDAVDNAYSSCAFTNIASSFFEKAAARFEGAGEKMTFDAEKDPASQVYKPGSYDVVVASNVSTLPPTYTMIRYPPKCTGAAEPRRVLLPPRHY